MSLPGARNGDAIALTSLPPQDLEHQALPTAKQVLLTQRQQTFTLGQRALSRLPQAPRAWTAVKIAGGITAGIGIVEGPIQLAIGYAADMGASTQSAMRLAGYALLGGGLGLGALALGVAFVAGASSTQAARHQRTLLTTLEGLNAHPAAVALLHSLVHLDADSVAAQRGMLSQHLDVIAKLPALCANKGTELIATLRDLGANEKISQGLNIQFRDTHYAIRRETGYLLSELLGYGLPRQRAAELNDEQVTLATELQAAIVGTQQGAFWYLQRLQATDRGLNLDAGPQAAARQLARAMLLDIGVSADLAARLTSRAGRIPADLRSDQSPLHHAVHQLLHLDGPDSVAANRLLLQSHLPLGTLEDLVGNHPDQAHFAFMRLTYNQQLGQALRIADRSTISSDAINHAWGLMQDLSGHGLSARADEVTDACMGHARNVLFNLPVAPFWYSLRQQVVHGQMVDLRAGGGDAARLLLSAVLQDGGAAADVAANLTQRAGQALREIDPDRGPVDATLHSLLHMGGPDRLDRNRSILESNVVLLRQLSSLFSVHVPAAAHALGQLSQTPLFTELLQLAGPPAFRMSRDALIGAMTLLDDFMEAQNDELARQQGTRIDQWKYNDAVKMLGPMITSHSDDPSKPPEPMVNERAAFWYERRLLALGREVPAFQMDPAVQARNIVRVVLEEAGARPEQLQSAMEQIEQIQQRSRP
jgi:hypothetical protein